jgi:hypothetical protein
MVIPAVETPADSRDEAAALRLLFHRLNNQLGIILAHAELLEAKSIDGLHRARAAQVVSSVLDAMATARDIRSQAVAERRRADDSDAA